MVEDNKATNKRNSSSCLLSLRKSTGYKLSGGLAPDKEGEGVGGSTGGSVVLFPEKAPYLLPECAPKQ